MHIPKTAGTWAYEKYFKGHPAMKNRDIAAGKCGKAGTEILVKGVNHATFGELLFCFENKFTTKKNFVVTQIRDPVDRVISEYYFFKDRMQSHMEENEDDNVNWWTEEMREIAMKGSFLDWINMEGNIAHNRQSFYLLHEGFDEDKRTIIARPDDNLTIRKNIFAKSMKELQSDVIKKLEENVKFASVKGDEKASDYVFEKVFARETKEVAKKTHPSNHPDIPQETQDLIREKNSLDSYLYQYTRGRLGEAYQKFKYASGNEIDM